MQSRRRREKVPSNEERHGLKSSRCGWCQSQVIYNWLARSDETICRVPILTEQKGKHMNATYLANRDQIIAKATELTSRVKSHWRGMGRTAAWIDTQPQFGRAIREAAARHVCVKVVVFLESGTPPYAQRWLDIGATVNIFDHGYMRLLLFDRTDAIIAFPMLVTNLSVDRDYFGWHVRGDPAVTQLINYYEQIEADAHPLPSDAVSGEEGSRKLREACREIWVRIIAWLVRRAPDWIT